MKRKALKKTGLAKLISDKGGFRGRRQILQKNDSNEYISNNRISRLLRQNLIAMIGEIKQKI